MEDDSGSTTLDEESIIPITQPSQQQLSQQSFRMMFEFLRSLNYFLATVYLPSQLSDFSVSNSRQIFFNGQLDSILQSKHEM